MISTSDTDYKEPSSASDSSFVPTAQDAEENHTQPLTRVKSAMDLVGPLTEIARDFPGLYAVEPDGSKKENPPRFNLKRCDLFSDDEQKQIAQAASIVESVLNNMMRLESVDQAYKELLDDLAQLRTSENDGRENVDRRYRAYITEWKRFIDQWLFYIEHIESKKKWRASITEAQKEEYKGIYKRLYDDLTHEIYDSTPEYAIACAVRNHVSHAGNAIDSISVSRAGKAKIYIHQKTLLESAHISRSQRKIITEQNEKIDLCAVAEVSLRAAEYLHEMLVYFQMDAILADAAQLLLRAKKKVDDSGVIADSWVLVNEGRFQMVELPDEYITLYRKPDGSTDVSKVDPIRLPKVKPGINIGYTPLPWSTYTVTADYLKQVWDSGYWRFIQERYRSV